MHTAPDRAPDWAALPAPELRLAFKAASRLIAALQELSDQGQQVVQRLIDGAEFTEWDHFPPDEVRDDRHASQYYFHAHAGEHRGFVERGHIHLFVHAEKLGMRRPDARFAPAPAHLVAVSMNGQGLPVGFFTVNRWVTKGPWLSAEHCRQGLAQFRIGAGRGVAPINHFLRALVGLYQCPLAALLDARDAELARLSAGRDRRSVFADRDIEVLSYQPIDLLRDIAALEDTVGL